MQVDWVIHYSYNRTMKFRLGGDLPATHIARRDVSEEAIRFWMAELVCAVQYLHSQGFVHRQVNARPMTRRIFNFFFDTPS